MRILRMGWVGFAALFLISFSPDDGWGRAFPYADRVPADASIYVAVPDLPELLDQLDRHPEWVATLGLESTLARLRKSRAWLAGPAAFYQRNGVWTALVRLKNGVTHVEGPEWSGADSMARAIAGFENDPPRTRIVLNFDALPSPAREALGEFALAVLEFEPGRLHGVLTYRPGMRDEMMGRRVHARPTPVPGAAPIAHSGLTNVADLLRAFKIESPMPPSMLGGLGPAWGVEVRSGQDLALWFEARGEALSIRPTQWRGFHVEVRDGRLHLWTRHPAEIGERGTHAQTRIDAAAAIHLLGVRIAYLDRLGHLEIATEYLADGARVDVRLQPR